MEKSININFRASESQKRLMEQKAKENGFESLSSYIKFMALNGTVTATAPQPTKDDLK